MTLLRGELRIRFTTCDQCEDRIGGSGMCDEMPVILFHRSREPASTGALVRLEPGNAFADSRIFRRHAGAA